VTRLKIRETGKFGKRGTIVIPSKLRKLFDIIEGGLFIAESTDEGILIRPAEAVPSEKYSKERVAEFLLTNAVDVPDYEDAREEVRRIGIDPDSIPHRKPE
jgi:AbrB family looped-hinge helix DNA binding protein